MSQLPATHPDEEEKSLGHALRGAAREIAQPFKDFVHTPRALWGVNIPWFFEGLVYFGILTVLPKYLAENVGLRDLHAGWVMGFLTSGITFSMLFFGGLADRWGVRKALILALICLVAGRAIMASGEVLHLSRGLFHPLFWSAISGIVLVILGYGMYQPAAYAACRQFTDQRTAAMGYAMLYALMNLGAFASGLVSPNVRRWSAHALPPNGVDGVFWVYVGVTALALLTTLLLLTPRDVKEGTRTNTAPPPLSPGAEAPRARIFSRQWLREHPLADARFSFFIFVLIPVQTLFAHNWLTMPPYVERAFRDTAWISNNFEFISNVNPVLIFVLTPLVAALTARTNVYWMMIVGTTVMAAPTFLLALGPNPTLLFVYIFTMSVGEAMWQPRFLQYAAEIAPEGKTGLYMGVAQFPWVLTKALTASYSGWFLDRYCPVHGAQNTQAMWLFHATVACISPLGLLLAKNWIGQDLERRHPRTAPAPA